MTSSISKLQQVFAERSSVPSYLTQCVSSDEEEDDDSCQSIMRVSIPDPCAKVLFAGNGKYWDPCVERGLLLCCM